MIDLSSEESQSSTASQEKPLPKPGVQSEKSVDLTTPRTTRAGVRRLTTPTKSSESVLFLAHEYIVTKNTCVFWYSFTKLLYGIK